MAREIKRSVAFWPGIDTEFDKMGDSSNFACTIMQMSDGATVANAGSGTFSELVRAANGHSGTTAGVASEGAYTVTLTTGSTLVVGDVIDDGAGNMYYITSVNGDVVGLKRPLIAEIADAVALNQVGNTGLYKVECNIDTLGEYMVTIAHPEFGNIALKYVVVENTLDDSVAANTSRFNQLDTAIETLGAVTRMKAIS